MQILPKHAADVSRAVRHGTMLAALASVCWLAGSCNPAQGETGSVHTSRGNGLVMTFDTRWVDGFGYRPVKVTATPTLLSRVDRTLTVEFYVRHGWQSDYDLRVAQDMEIPAGSGPVAMTLSVPQHVPLHQCDINVFEDGELLEKLSVKGISFNNFGFGSQPPESLPSMLVVGQKASGQSPDTALLADLLPVENYEQWNRGPRANNQNGRRLLPTAVSRTLDELPQRWIDYSSLDIVCLSLTQLTELRQDHPAKFQAVLRWAAAGGNLLVYGMGDDWFRLGELEGLVGLPPRAGEDDSPTAGWNKPGKQFFNWEHRGRNSGPYGGSSGSFRERINDQGVGTISSPNEAAIDVTARSMQSRPQARIMFGPPHFVLRPYGMGMIVALKDHDPFDSGAQGRMVDEEQKAKWSWVLGELGRDRWQWYRRHGVSMVRENRDFMNFLIPGVGLAPVTEFCVLISLFVLGIGPLNYWLLRRWGRQYLLVVTIPFSATVVTLALFAYAMVADGLGTRVRVRSVTQIDQRRGQAVCWSRLSYYAGLAPGRGLTFPEDIAVLPLDRVPRTDYGSKALRRELIWQDGQWLASGWLHSRTPAQLLTVRSRPTDLALEVVPSPDDPKKLQASNWLGTRIQHLAVRAADGTDYWAEDVDPDETVTLKPMQQADRDRWVKSCKSHEPELPPGLDSRYQDSLFGLSYRYRYWRHDDSLDDPRQAAGLLERTLAATTSTLRLERGSYAAIVDRSPEVDLGVLSANEEASLHVIVGSFE